MDHQFAKSPGKSASLRRYYSRKRLISLQNIDRIYALELQDADPLSNEAIIAALVFWMKDLTIDLAIQRMERLASVAGFDKFDLNFFTDLEQESYNLYLAGMNQHSSNLLKAGQVLAQMVHCSEKADQFDTMLNLQTWKNIKDQPYLKQRPW